MSSDQQPPVDSRCSYVDVPVHACYKTHSWKKYLLDHGHHVQVHQLWLGVDNAWRFFHPAGIVEAVWDVRVFKLFAKYSSSGHFYLEASILGFRGHASQILGCGDMGTP